MVSRDVFTFGGSTSVRVHLARRALGVSEEDVRDAEPWISTAEEEISGRTKETLIEGGGGPEDYLSTAEVPQMSEEVRSDLEEMGFVIFARAWERVLRNEREEEQEQEERKRAPLKQEDEGKLSKSLYKKTKKTILLFIAAPRPALCSLPLDETVCSVVGAGDSEEDRSDGFRFDPRSGFCRPVSCSASVAAVNVFDTYAECAKVCGEFSGKTSALIESGNDGLYDGASVTREMRGPWRLAHAATYYNSLH